MNVKMMDFKEAHAKIMKNSAGQCVWIQSLSFGE